MPRDCRDGNFRADFLTLHCFTEDDRNEEVLSRTDMLIEVWSSWFGNGKMFNLDSPSSRVYRDLMWEICSVHV